MKITKSEYVLYFIFRSVKRVHVVFVSSSTLLQKIRILQRWEYRNFEFKKLQNLLEFVVFLS